jgi:hypothetical protein
VPRWRRDFRSKGALGKGALGIATDNGCAFVSEGQRDD